MAAQYMIDIFPDLTKLLQEEAPRIWTVIFPPTLQEKCPEITTQFTLGKEQYTLRSWPLALLAWIGAVIGWTGFKWLIRRDHHIFWAFSFFFYAFMNLAAILCHSLLARQTPLWEKFLLLDVACTGSAATLAALAALRIEPVRKPVAVLFAFAVGLFFNATALYGKVHGEPWLNEIIYILTSLLATAAFAFTELGKQDLNKHQNFGVGIVIIGAVVAGNGILADQWLCKRYGLALNACHFLFLGCAVIYYGLFYFLKGAFEKDKTDKEE